MAYDWAKLWIEMLDDRKTASLPDSSWRRFVECILLAMEVNQGGRLPTVQDMAWRLRVTPETMGDDLTRLALGGLVELDANNVWKVTNFVKRQSAIPMADRVASHREREKKKRRAADSNVTVTSQKRDGNEHVTESYTDKIRIDKNREEAAVVTTPSQNVTSRAPQPRTRIPNDAHPAVRAVYQVTTFWPAEAAQPVIIEKLGDNPDLKALERAYQLWMGRGYNPKNWDAIGEWYKELVHDPAWMPPAQHKNGNAPNGANETESLWQKALSAINAGRVDDERLKAAIKAIGGSSAIKSANEFTTRQLKERLASEYRTIATA